MTTKDRAYPFPGKGVSPTACTDTYGFTSPCSPALENLARSAALTFFLVTLASILTKVSPRLVQVTYTRLCSRISLSGSKY